MRPNRTLCIAIIVLLFSAIQQQQNQLLAFVLLMERWINSCNRLLAASLRARNRRLRQLRRAPYAWSLPRPNESWFEIHYHDLTIPDDFFRQQLRMNRATFNTVLDVLGARIVRQNSRFRSCLSPAKVLAIGLYRLRFPAFFISIFWPLRHTRAQNDNFWQHRMRFPLFEKNLAKSASPTQAHRRLWWFSRILKFLVKRKRWVALENACVDRF